MHEIKTGDAAPVRKQRHRVPWALREEMHGQIGEMKEKEVYQVLQLNWQPLQFSTQKKKNSPDNTRKYRFCADFKERHNLEDPGVDGRIILRWIQFYYQPYALI